MNPILPIVEPPLVPGQPAPTPPGEQTLGEEAFLKLLTEQLQNQDPLDPMKNEDFVAQLAQFSSLEQLVGMQSTLEAVYLGIASMNNASMANLLGTEVVAAGNQVSYSGEGSAELHFDSATDFDNATVTITDEDGTVVKTIELGGHPSGEFSVSWDGTDLSGQDVGEGTYTFSISASTAEGGDVSVQTLVVGVVDEMDYSTGTPQPSIGGVSVALEGILRLTAGEGTDP